MRAQSIAPGLPGTSACGCVQVYISRLGRFGIAQLCSKRGASHSRYDFPCHTGTCQEPCRVTCLLHAYPVLPVCFMKRFSRLTALTDAPPPVTCLSPASAARHSLRPNTRTSSNLVIPQYRDVVPSLPVSARHYRYRSLAASDHSRSRSPGHTAFRPKHSRLPRRKEAPLHACSADIARMQRHPPRASPRGDIPCIPFPPPPLLTLQTQSVRSTHPPSIAAAAKSPYTRLSPGWQPGCRGMGDGRAVPTCRRRPS